MPVLATISTSVTSFVGDHGIYAVFGLMLIDAVFPAASELVMLYAGALAAGAFAGERVFVFGQHIATPFWAFVAVALAGTIGNTLGSLGGWAIGAYGGRATVERHGRWLHMSPAKLDRADRWFERFGLATVLVGRVVPVARSFVSYPAGFSRMPLGRFTALTFAGCLPWCFGIAAAGWALGASYERFNGDFKYAEYAVGVAFVAAVIWLLVRRRSSRLARRAEDPAR